MTNIQHKISKQAGRPQGLAPTMNNDDASPHVIVGASPCGPTYEYPASSNDSPTLQKIYGRAELAQEVQRRQATGERAVFTNGCFDLLHLGHVRYLQEARALGDFLILGLNSDESVRHLKGVDRPLVPEMERAEILAALTCIDYVTIFTEPTAEQIVSLLQPAIYVKGGDWGQDLKPDLSRLVEAKIVQAYGGTVRLIPYLPNHSTTALITAIQHLSSIKG